MNSLDTSTGAYLVYLISAEANSTTFGVDTSCIEPEVPRFEMSQSGDAETCCSRYKGRKPQEIRFPSLVNTDKINCILEDMDVSAALIRDWQRFFRWLGGDPGQGWALFTPEFAAKFVPHWVLPGANYPCVPCSNGSFFVDTWLCPNLCSLNEERLQRRVGTSPEESAKFHDIQLGSNMVVTRQKIFS